MIKKEKQASNLPRFDVADDPCKDTTMTRNEAFHDAPGGPAEWIEQRLCAAVAALMACPPEAGPAPGIAVVAEHSRALRACLADYFADSDLDRLEAAFAARAVDIAIEQIAIHRARLVAQIELGKLFLFAHNVYYVNSFSSISPELETRSRLT